MQTSHMYLEVREFGAFCVELGITTGDMLKSQGLESDLHR
jgi:hypothetical protein